MTRDVTFRANLGAGRHGWVRLTPAYAAPLVAELLPTDLAPGDVILDPFSGSGTTPLVCAERGIACDAVDVNPFCVWLTQAKTRPYDEAARQVARARARGEGDAVAALRRRGRSAWRPPMNHLERWWGPRTLDALARLFATFRDDPAPALDLLRVAFCRTSLACSAAAFNHQSVSFHGDRASDPDTPVAAVERAWRGALDAVLQSTAGPFARADVRVVEGDARTLAALPDRASGYAAVVTSPPYPNRMSYVREFRPHLYWLGFLRDARGAGELDWRALGGTWGVATSRLTRWEPPTDRPRVPGGLDAAVARLRDRHPLLGRYLHRYMVDFEDHVRAVAPRVRPGGVVQYVVGNVRFFDATVPVEAATAQLFTEAGFVDVAVKILRRRTSKRELYEYLVSGRRPGGVRA